MDQRPPHSPLDSLALAALLAVAGTAVLLWTPVLVAWTALTASRRSVIRRGAAHRHPSLVG